MPEKRARCHGGWATNSSIRTDRVTNGDKPPDAKLQEDGPDIHAGADAPILSVWSLLDGHVSSLWNRVEGQIEAVVSSHRRT